MDWLARMEAYLEARSGLIVSDWTLAPEGPKLPNIANGRAFWLFPRSTQQGPYRDSWSTQCELGLLFSLGNKAHNSRDAWLTVEMQLAELATGYTEQDRGITVYLGSVTRGYHTSAKSWVVSTIAIRVNHPL